MTEAKSFVLTESSRASTPAENEIHLWRISLGAELGDVNSLVEVLSPAEQQHAARFHFAPDRRRFVIRRAVLRQLLATCLGQHPSAITLEIGPHGKPAVSGQAGMNGLRFSSSHSGDMALIALACGRELGVDLEQHRLMTDAAEVAKQFFSPAEVIELTCLPLSLKKAGFFNCWTRKEAFVKATGLGLTYPLNRFTVSLAPGKPAQLLKVEDDPDALTRWGLISLDVAPDCSAALVYEGMPAVLKCFSCQATIIG